MKHKNIIIFHFMMTSISIFNRVSGLLTEGIVGGYTAEIKTFNYVIEIEGRKNNSNIYESRCGGALLSGFIAISAAHCFMDANKNLAQVTFSVKAGSNIFNDNNALHVDIAVIYRHQVYIEIYMNDIALSKLKDELDIKGNQNLGKLNLPRRKESFVGYTAKFAGFGYQWVTYGINYSTGVKEKTGIGSHDNYLKYGLIKIQSYKIQSEFNDIDISMILGIMIPEENKAWGPCTGDSGNVLVINKTAVGILVACQADCDDGSGGSVYLEVSAYVDFIEGVMTGILSRDTLIFPNYAHVVQ